MFCVFFTMYKRSAQYICWQSTPLTLRSVNDLRIDARRADHPVRIMGSLDAIYLSSFHFAVDVCLCVCLCVKGGKKRRRRIYIAVVVLYTHVFGFGLFIFSRRQFPVVPDTIPANYLSVHGSLTPTHVYTYSVAL